MDGQEHFVTNHVFHIVLNAISSMKITVLIAESGRLVISARTIVVDNVIHWIRNRLASK